MTSTLPPTITIPTADPDGTLDGSATTTLAPGATVDTMDFGYQPLGSVGDTIFRDDNGNGTQDTGEPGLGGIDVQLLDSTGTLITTATTDGNGNYDFTGLAAGTYQVSVVTSTLPRPSRMPTADPDGGADSTATIVLTAGAAADTMDFGYQPLGSIGDTIFRDDNGNGTQDAGELGLGGVGVELLDASSSVIATAITDAAGVYGFSGLAGGVYTVRVDATTLPAGLSTITADPDASLDGENQFTLTDGGDIDTIDFGYQPLGTIGDTVYRDDNGNGIQEESEPGLSGIGVRLLDDTGSLLATATTNSNGSYSFPSLPSGSYVVAIDAATLPPTITTVTGDPDGVLDASTSISLNPGQQLTTVDFGYQPTGTIGTTIFADDDGDGSQDPGEPGIAGVSVSLLDGGGRGLRPP